MRNLLLAWQSLEPKAKVLNAKPKKAEHPTTSNESMSRRSYRASTRLVNLLASLCSFDPEKHTDPDVVTWARNCVFFRA